MMRPIRITAAVVCVASVAFMFGGCRLFPKEEAQIAPPLVKVAKQTYDTTKVAKGNINVELVGSARMVSQSDCPMYFNYSGLKLRKIYVTVGDKVKKGQMLAETETGDLDNQITLEQYSVQLRQLDVQRANMGTDTIAQQVAQINLKIEQTKLAQLQTQKNSSTIVSPIDGQITYTANLTAGSAITSYATVVTVCDPDKLMANGSLSKSDASNISLGMKCSLIATDGTAYAGTVTALPDAASLSSSSGGGDESGIMIKLDNPGGLKATIGDVMQLKIVTLSKSNTLVVPKSAVKQIGGSTVVDTWDGTTKKELPVQLGIQSSTMAEILSGVNEGDSVILN